MKDTYKGRDVEIKKIVAGKYAIMIDGYYPPGMDYYSCVDEETAWELAKRYIDDDDVVSDDRMTASLERSFNRLEHYVAIARQSAECGNLPQAMADIAEASEISLRLWKELARTNAAKGITDGNRP